jgi:hypothetical protein
MPDDHLYKVKGGKVSKTRHLSTNTSLNFSSNLESLLAAGASDKSRTATSGRARPSKEKDDIFKAHNRNSAKRAAKDVAEHALELSRANIGDVDDSLLHRSKRKMEEKTRLYNAMKRGDYVPPNEDSRGGLDERERGLIDFDRKWAENKDAGHVESSSDEDLEEDHYASAEVEYVDEFGRTRVGTRAAAARAERALRARDDIAAEPDRYSARPVEPGQLIYGDTIQTEAFNPDRQTSEAMKMLATRRDRSLTPPEEEHYDATKEIRTRGTGFYAFSKDASLRKLEMEALERERQETEKKQQEAAEKRKKREQEIEERRRKIAEIRGRKKAADFLDGLDLELGSSGTK